MSFKSADFTIVTPGAAAAKRRAVAEEAQAVEVYRGRKVTLFLMSEAPMFKEGSCSERAFRMASKICMLYGIQVSDIGRDFATAMESVFSGVETVKEMQVEIIKAFRSFQRVLDGGGFFTHAIEAAKQEVRGERGVDVDLLRDTGFQGQFGALKLVDGGDALDAWLDEEDFGGVQADPMGGAAGAGGAGADLFTIGEEEEG